MGAKRLARDEAWSLARDLVRAFAADATDAERLALFHDIHALLGLRLEDLLDRCERERSRVGRAAVMEPPPVFDDPNEQAESGATQHRDTRRDRDDRPFA